MGPFAFPHGLRTKETRLDQIKRGEEFYADGERWMLTGDSIRDFQLVCMSGVNRGRRCPLISNPQEKKVRKVID